MTANRSFALSRTDTKFIDLGHCRVAYQTVGSGPPLLLVHGYPLSGLTFRHLVPVLAKHFTCFIPDLPGLGDTIWSKETDFGFAAQAETLKAFADGLGLEHYSIVAHDTGGTIARRLAVIDGNRLVRMALMGTEIPGHRPPWIPFFQKIADPNRPAVFKFLMGQRWFRRSSAAFGGCFADLDLIDGEFSELFLKPMLADNRRIHGQTRYLMGIDWELLDGLKADHAKITAPVLLIWGADDPVFPVDEARAMTSQFGNCSGFVTIPRGKLFIHEEMPEQVLPILLDFLLRDERPLNASPTAAALVAANLGTGPGASATRTRLAPGATAPAQVHRLLDAGGAMVLLILATGFLAPTAAWLKWGKAMDAVADGSFELCMLVCSALLALMLPMLQIGLHIRRFGGSVIRGNRDFYPATTGAAARVARAHANAIESLAPFAVVVLAAHALGVSNRWTIAASALFFAARLTHSLTYVLGIPVIRSSAFYAAWIATAVIAVNLLHQAL